MALSVESHFFQDVHDDLERALRHLGVNLPDTSGESHLNGKVRFLCTEFFHQLRRRISAQPRQVLWSKELLARAWVGSERQAVDHVAAELSLGTDATPRMTRSIKKSVRETVAERTYDGLLTDWGIHHLHLGSKVESDGFVERRGPLLFVFVKNERVHLLDLLDHHAFTNHRLFQIIHDNWPDAIAEWRIRGAVPGSLSPKHDPAIRRMIRTKLTMGTEATDGTPYLPPGGGVMLSGHSSEADRQACTFLNWVHPAEVWAQDQALWIHGRILLHTGIDLPELRMKFETQLSMNRGQAVVSESRTRVRFVGVPPDTEGNLKVGVPAELQKSLATK